jgi:hypothetical protein
LLATVKYSGRVVLPFLSLLLFLRLNYITAAGCDIFNF